MDVWTEAIPDDGTLERCHAFARVLSSRPMKCSHEECGGTLEDCCILSYHGCMECKPERYLKGRVRRGPAAKLLARTALTFATLCSGVTPVGGLATQTSRSRPFGPNAVVSGLTDQAIDFTTGPIIEEPGGIRHMSDCEVPTEEYYTALAADMKARHPKASPAVLEHLAALMQMRALWLHCAGSGRALRPIRPRRKRSKTKTGIAPTRSSPWPSKDTVKVLSSLKRTQPS